MPELDNMLEERLKAAAAREAGSMGVLLDDALEEIRELKRKNERLQIDYDRYQEMSWQLNPEGMGK